MKIKATSVLGALYFLDLKISPVTLSSTSSIRIKHETCFTQNRILIKQNVHSDVCKKFPILN